MNNNPIRLGEMEHTNVMIAGSISHMSHLTNMYSNNSDLRKRLLVELYAGNPFRLRTNFEKRIQNNNTKVLNAYFTPLNVSIDYGKAKDEELTSIMDLSPDQLEYLMEKYEDINDINDINSLTSKEINDTINEIKNSSEQ